MSYLRIRGRDTLNGQAFGRKRQGVAASSSVNNTYHVTCISKKRKVIFVDICIAFFSGYNMQYSLWLSSGYGVSYKLTFTHNKR